MATLPSSIPLPFAILVLDLLFSFRFLFRRKKSLFFY
jgi:hypothetical protein